VKPVEPVKQDARSMSQKAKMLVVDDEPSLREMLRICFRREGFEVSVADSGEAALGALQKETFNVVVSDIRMPDMTGIDLLKSVHAEGLAVPVILLTAYASTDTAIQALKIGAFDYVLKTDNFIDELKHIVNRALEERRLREENSYLKREFRKTNGIGSLIGRSPTMQEVFHMIEVVSETTSTVLITGESGTGKELAAKAIHVNSPRSEEKFVSVNCGALTETLLESELFGYVKGSFTGAMNDRKGLFEVADRGTLFLDEIGETSPATQVKLLRVLQERAVRRVGGAEEIRVDVRIIAATNRNLSTMVREGEFREDLFYRISVFPLEMPPLRDRSGDIVLLVDHFLAQLNRTAGHKIGRVSEDAMEKLEGYSWPGNVRELENAIERAFILETTGELSEANLSLGASGGLRAKATPVIPAGGLDFETYMEDLQRDYFQEALRRSGGVQVKAAELLGIPYRSFRHYMRKFNVTAEK
jgi:two-component system response regulator PilR (NtrC family)